jgi:hypothetical protein
MSVCASVRATHRRLAMAGQHRVRGRMPRAVAKRAADPAPTLKFLDMPHCPDDMATPAATRPGVSPEGWGPATRGAGSRLAPPATDAHRRSAWVVGLHQPNPPDIEAH